MALKSEPKTAGGQRPAYKGVSAGGKISCGSTLSWSRATGNGQEKDGEGMAAEANDLIISCTCCGSVIESRTGND